MEKVCPRCGNFFSCLHDSIPECQCMFVSLDKKQLTYIAENYSDCLCHACLEEIRVYFYTFSVNPRYHHSLKNKKLI